MATAFFLLYIVFTLAVLAQGVSALVWELGSVAYLLVATFALGLSWFSSLVLWIFIPAVIILRRLPVLQNTLGGFIFERAKKAIPKLSKTEEEALNAGDTWIEQSIFRGEPDWKALSEIQTELTDEESGFLAQETDELCQMLNDWEITQAGDLPEPVWQFLKDKGFFGLVISKEYGGKGFSARAHSDIVMRIASRSGVAAVTVMVPNSLGPGELLHHYGTKEQKEHYLPRLASGQDIPCFALTEPEAGSDATSIQAEAIVAYQMIDGEKVLGLRMTLNKRWITLAPVATLIGLAVDLKDPDGLLRGTGAEGITCVLIPRDSAGLDIGNRHLAAQQPFMNGTIRGTDVFAPITSIIGGQKEAGCGWQMLVECLSIGRSISLPALGTASSSVAYLTTGAFSRLRRQFSVELAQFEGIEEKLAEIAGLNYLVTATRLLTVAAVNTGKKPSVASAITKYFNTELPRRVLNAAMDVHGGRMVVVGPRNYLSNFYQGIPISVTVEGANIMTRNLLIFGQGSMACHPFLRDEFYAISKGDSKAFQALLGKHANYFASNLAKTLCSAWTGGRLIRVPAHPMKRECRQLARLSYALAWISDCSLMILGGDLKRKERLSARLGDALGYLYLAMAALRQVELRGGGEDEILHARWALRFCFHQTTQALLSMCRNFPSRTVGVAMRLLAFPFGGLSAPYPADKLDHQLAKLMTTNSPYRDDLRDAVYVSGEASDPVGKMESAFQLYLEAMPLYRNMKGSGRLKSGTVKEKLAEKRSKGMITEEEMKQLLNVERARWDAIQVDEFTFDSMKKKTYASIIDTYDNPID
ncbi:MAG: acyl-CoA dehydrogenase [Gammaproteobacteria bacterium]|nr:acyl-CoA dehydrogenase [Gammaproteobacteria bacterium]MCH9763890.1 acyl-CoA dehydrogenase [Gammaproteobacteria bacterium]